MKKTLALLLSAVMLLSLALPAFAQMPTGTFVPIIHVHGLGTAIINEQGEDVYTVNIDKGAIVEQVKAVVPEFLEAMKLKPDDAWTLYRNRVREIVLPCFGPYFLDKNGEASDGTHVNWTWEHGNLPDKKGESGYHYGSYPFYFDWRVDPFESAALLNDYVQDVKKATGSDKVNICARCEGGNVLLAYFAQYGYDDVKCAQFYASASKGIDLVSALFSGKISIDADAVRRYQEQNYPVEDPVADELINTLIELTGDTFLLDVAAFSLEVFSLVKIYDEVLVPLILETYGTMPGIWSMVDAEDYATARRNIFKGKEAEYAGLIEKLDHYDTVVRQRADEIVMDAVKAGVKVANFAKYGDYQTMPFGKHSNDIGDNTVALSVASFGATVAKYGKTLSDDYLANAAKNGTDRYISPDRMVDASTCLLPDTTWFIYGNPHSSFQNFIFAYMIRFFAADGELTVFDDPTFPQYMIAVPDPENPADGQKLVPMTEENAPSFTVEQRNIHNVDWKDLGLRLLKALWNFLKMLFAK